MTKDPSPQELAEELSSVCPEEGGHRVGMFYDILNVIEQERSKQEEARKEFKEYLDASCKDTKFFEARVKQLEALAEFGMDNVAKTKIIQLELRIKDLEQVAGPIDDWHHSEDLFQIKKLAEALVRFTKFGPDYKPLMKKGWVRRFVAGKIKANKVLKSLGYKGEK